MANPQKEDGNTGINNKVLERLISSGLNGTELAICLFIIRKTWGYNKLSDEISLTQFMDAIPTTKPSICKALSNLQLVKIILLVKKGKSKISSNEWKFNKDYETWQLVKKSKLVKKTKLTSKENFTNNIKIQKKEYIGGDKKRRIPEARKTTPNTNILFSEYGQSTITEIMEWWPSAKMSDKQISLNNLRSLNLTTAAAYKNLLFDAILYTLDHRNGKSQYHVHLENFMAQYAVKFSDYASQERCEKCQATEGMITLTDKETKERHQLRCLHKDWNSIMEFYRRAEYNV